jgi:hypothetical protein
VLIAGKLRLSHIEQFWTQQKAIRITGEAQPIEWLEVNKTDPDSGEVMNDLTAREADFYVGEQDYRESYIRAAMEQTFQLLGQIATFAPQVVLAVLDLAVDSAELPNKDEWVSRIRKLNGQRDPTKAPTPEEEAQAQIDGEKKALQEQLAVEMAQAQLAKEQANAAKLDVEAMAKRVDVLMQALTAAQLAATNPALAPVADEMAAAAGFKPQGGTDPNIPQPTAAPTPMDSAAPIDPTQQPAGPEAGIPPQEFQ